MVVGHINTLLEAMKQGHTERLTQFLAFSSRFHLYSLRNQELIYLQCPEATRVASYKEWKEEGYQVCKMDKAKEERRTMSLHTQVYADNPALCLHRPGYGPLILSCRGTLRELDTRPIERRWEGTSLSCSVRIKVGCLGRSSERISSHGNCVCDYQRADKRVSRSIGIDLLKFPIDDVAALLICLPWPHAGAITRVAIP